jgi:hypothetical protein
MCVIVYERCKRGGEKKNRMKKRTAEKKLRMRETKIKEKR